MIKGNVRDWYNLKDVLNDNDFYIKTINTVANKKLVLTQQKTQNLTRALWIYHELTQKTHTFNDSAVMSTSALGSLI